MPRARLGLVGAAELGVGEVVEVGHNRPRPPDLPNRRRRRHCNS